MAGVADGDAVGAGTATVEVHAPSAATIAQIQSAKAALNASYGNISNDTGPLGQAMNSTMDYYQGLPKKQRQAAFLKLYQNIAGRDLSNWSGDPGNIALFQDLDPAAREAYSIARGEVGQYGEEGGGTAASEAGLLEFTKGVSGKSGAFITEGASQSRLKSGEAEDTGPTKKKKKTATKLIKTASKKSGVKRKALRRAINTKGTTKKEAALYKKAGPPKLSTRLRMADRRINKAPGKKK